MNNKETSNKRFKIAIMSILLIATFGLIGIILNLPTSVILTSLAGIQAISIAFIAGDSYRKSNLNEENKYQEE